MKMEEKPILILKKKVEKVASRIILPKEFVEKNGEQLFMEVYKDKIILKPANDSLNEEI